MFISEKSKSEIDYQDKLDHKLHRTINLSSGRLESFTFSATIRCLAYRNDTMKLLFAISALVAIAYAL